MFGGTLNPAESNLVDCIEQQQFTDFVCIVRIYGAGIRNVCWSAAFERELLYVMLLTVTEEENSHYTHHVLHSLIVLLLLLSLPVLYHITSSKQKQAFKGLCTCLWYSLIILTASLYKATSSGAAFSKVPRKILGKVFILGAS